MSSSIGLPCYPISENRKRMYIIANSSIIEVISKLARNGQRMTRKCAGNGLSRGVPTAKSVF